MIVSRQFCVFVCVCVLFILFSLLFSGCLFVHIYIHTHTHTDGETESERDRQRHTERETVRERHTHTQRHTDYYYYYLPMTTGLVVGVKAAVYLILQLFDVAKERCGFWTSNSLLTPRRQCPCAVPETDHQQPDGR